MKLINSLIRFILLVFFTSIYDFPQLNNNDNVFTEGLSNIDQANKDCKAKPFSLNFDFDDYNIFNIFNSKGGSKSESNKNKKNNK